MDTGVLVGVVGFLLATVVAHWKLAGDIRKTIDERVTSDEVITKIASRVRPYAIIDSQSSVKHDGGAMAYIEKLEFKFENADKRYPTQIKMIMKKHLHNAPLISSLQTDGFTQTVEQGETFNWVYELDYFMHGPDNEGPRIFMIQIL